MQLSKQKKADVDNFFSLKKILSQAKQKGLDKEGVGGISDPLDYTTN